MPTFPFCLLPRIHLFFSFHLSTCFATCFQVWLFFTSLPFVASVSSGLKKSFTSSSHLFLSLFTALHVLILVLNPGFHSAAFLTHRSFGGDTILIANRHFILLCIPIEHGILAALIQSLCLSLLQRRRRYLGRNRCQCCFLVSLSEFSWLSFLSQCPFLIFMLLAIFFFVFSSCLYSGSKHLPFCLLYQSFVFVCQSPCSTRVAQCRREHHI